MTTPSIHHECARHNFRNPITALVLLAVVLLAGIAWSGDALAQPKIARIGVLSFSPIAEDPNLKTFMRIVRHELANQGWIEGKNVQFEFRSARNDPSQLTRAATELVKLKVDVISADSATATRAAFAATRTIPIVAYDYTTNPISEGYIESYARPGGNVTGVFLDTPMFAGKWFELLKALIPDLSRVSVIWDPGPGNNHLQAVRSVARLSNVKLQILEARRPDELDRAFTELRGRPQAVIFLPSPMIYGQDSRLARLALRHGLPAIAMSPNFVSAGGAIAYGPDSNISDARIAALLAKILDGATPAKLPVERPAIFKLSVNIKTAKALGIDVPQSILLRADEVIP